MPASQFAPRPSIEQLLDMQVQALDELIAEVRLGIRSAVHFDSLEERAQAIAGGLRRAFREGER